MYYFSKMINIPPVTVEQMREVDRLMVDEIGVSIRMMMENASRNIAVLARKMLDGSVKRKTITVLCGKGNNGGDGLGAARHLINFGANVCCFLATSYKDLGIDAFAQYKVLKNIQAPIYEFSKSSIFSDTLSRSDLVIDALLGYNLKGNPKEPIATLIHLSNIAPVPILAVDIPSGLDGNTGQPHAPTIKAKMTITLALPKVGLLTDSAKQNVGELYLADLSVPAVVYKKLGIDVPVLFEHEEIVRIF